MSDHYAILGVSPGATAETIKTSYRRKANQYHPDRNPSADAAQRFREVQEAYETLGDPARRKGYDEHRQRSLIDHPETVAREIWNAYITEVAA